MTGSSDLNRSLEDMNQRVTRKGHLAQPSVGAAFGDSYGGAEYASVPAGRPQRPQSAFVNSKSAVRHGRILKEQGVMGRVASGARFPPATGEDFSVASMR